MEPPSTCEGLTLYELNRAPRPVLPEVDPSTMELETVNIAQSESGEVNVQALSLELRCPICFDTLKQTMMVKECLHRFCKECIEKCLRLDQNARCCPSCRVHIPSRRSLRKDTKMDSLILKLIPSVSYDSHVTVDFGEEHKRRVLAMRSRQKERQEMMQHEAPVVKHQRTVRKPKKKREEVLHVCFTFSPCPALDVERSPFVPIIKPYIRAPAMIRVSDLKSYLMRKVKPGRAVATSAIEIFMLCKHTRQTLADESTLQDVCLQHWDGNSEFAIYFRPTSDTSQ